MNKLKLLCLFVSISGIAFVQSCKLTAIEPPCPTVLGISSAVGRFGENIMIRGKDFIPNEPSAYKVTIGDKAVSDIEVPNDSTLSFKVPIGIGNGPLLVSLEGGTPCAMAQNIMFTYHYTGTTVELYTGTPMVNNCTSPTQDCLNNPNGIDLDREGNLIVADKGNHVIRKFTSTGKITYGKLPIMQGCDSLIVNDSKLAAFRSPVDVEVGSNGDVYVAEETNNIIRRLNNSGSAEVHAGKCQRSRITDGNCSVALIGAPYSITSDVKNVYFVDNGSIRLSDGCSITTKKVNGGTAYFRAIEFNSTREGKPVIYIADNKDKSIKSLDLANSGNDNIKVLTPLSSGLSEPSAITLDSKGNIFFTDRAQNKIYVLYVNGDLVTLAGSGTAGYLNGQALNAQFRRPLGLALDETKGILYISDTENHVIRKLSFQ